SCTRALSAEPRAQWSPPGRALRPENARTSCTPPAPSTRRGFAATTLHLIGYYARCVRAINRPWPTRIPPSWAARSVPDADAHVVEGEVLMPDRVIGIHGDAVDPGVRIAMRDGPADRVRPVAEIPVHRVAQGVGGQRMAKLSAVFREAD